MYKIYCLNNISPEGLALLTDNYEVTENIDEADAILVRSADMHEMEVPANLKAVARAGAGVNNIPLDKFAEAGIAVFNTPGANANAVKELVLAGMLLASRDIIGGVAWVRDNADDENVGKAAEKAKKQFAGGEILGKTLGVIGLGAIGKLVAQSAEALGMKVIGYDPYLTQDKIGDLCELKATAKEVWEQADFVSVHLPVVPSTEHSIGREQFSWMKPTASFINCARGALIKENELVECLKDGTLFQAGLDVFEHEPIQESSRELFDLDNVIMTPHMAATTEQSVLNCCTSVANDIVAVCNGQEPKVKAQKPKF